MQWGPCLRNPLSMSFKASSMAPAVPDRRVDGATVRPGARRTIISGPTGYGGAPMPPLRHHAKSMVPRSLIAVSVRLVQRYARARARRTRAAVQKSKAIPKARRSSWRRAVGGAGADRASASGELVRRAHRCAIGKQESCWTYGGQHQRLRISQSRRYTRGGAGQAAFD